MDKLARAWHEIATSKWEDHKEIDQIQADAERNLDLMTFAVMHWDLSWQRDWTGGAHDVWDEFSLGIAESLYADMKWEIVGQNDYRVVSDRSRSIVFDVPNFDQVSAGASLVLAEDTVYRPDEVDLRGVTVYRENQLAILQNAQKIAEAAIEFANLQREGNVVPIK